MSVQADVTLRELDSGLDRWLQRGAVVAMITVGLLLLGIGVSLFRDIPSRSPVSEEVLGVNGDLP